MSDQPHNPLRVPCPWCRAPVRRPCTAIGTTVRPLHGSFHPARIDAAELADAPSDAPAVEAEPAAPQTHSADAHDFAEPRRPPAQVDANSQQHMNGAESA